MRQFIYVLVSLAFIFSSCGSGKKLQAANEQIQTLNTQVASLKKQVTDNQKTIATDQTSISQLKADNIKYGKEAEDCNKAKAMMAQRLDNLKNNLAEKGTSMEQIRAKIAEALDRLHTAGAEVHYKNGLIFVSLQDKLVFPSASAKVSDMGKQALSVIADVLIDNPGIQAIVVGNTDTLPIRGAYTDNWSLSTERANTIVRVLRDKYQIDPARLTAAGRGKYNPVADNATEEGRATNRRTDIILNPDMSRFWKMMEENP